MRIFWKEILLIAFLLIAIFLIGYYANAQSLGNTGTISTFSGTHFLPPRTVIARFGYSF
jgi:hypothetical protein